MLSLIMDKDVEAKMNRLVSRYKEVSMEITSRAPEDLPTTKGSRRVEQHVSDLLGRFGDSRRAQVHPLVKLAYVRGLRGTSPEARLSDEQMLEVQALSDQLNTQLTTLERRSWASFSAYLRRMRTIDRLKSHGENGEIAKHIRWGFELFPLEQRACACIHSVLEVASTLGALAGTRSGDYDGEVNG